MARVPAAERRNDFVRAAVTVIATHGVEGATTRRIAEEANAPLASLHYCFSSKELLFAAVFDELKRVLEEDVFPPNVRHASVAEAASDFLRRIMTWYYEESEFTAAAVELMLWARRQDRNPAMAPYETAYASLARVIREAATNDRSLQDDVIARIPPLIIAISDGFVLKWIAFRGAPDFERDVALAVASLDAYVVSQVAAGPSSSRRKRSPAKSACSA